MEVKVKETVVKEVKYLDVIAGDRVYVEDIGIGMEEFDEWDDVFEKYPALKCGNGLYLRINVDNGFVENWPVGVKGYFGTVKVVDEGIYTLRDSNFNEVVKYEGYVPKCLEIDRDGWGDYWEFNIDEHGYIINWKFTQKDVDELSGVGEED